MVEKRPLQGHLPDAVLLRHKAQQPGGPQLQAVHPPQRDAEKPLKVPLVYPGAVGSPEEIVHHPLAEGKPQGQGGGKHPALHPSAILLDGKGVDLELLPQQGGGGAAEAQEVVPGHGGVPSPRPAREGPDGGTGIPLLQTVGGDLVQQPPLLPLVHCREGAGGKGEVDKGVDGHMVCPAGKGQIHIRPQVLEGLPREGEDQVHGHRLEGDLLQGGRQGGQVHRPAPQEGLILLLKGLHPYADLRHASLLQCPQEGDGHVVRVELHSDPLGDGEVLPYRPDDLPQPPGGQGRGPATEVQASDLPSALRLAAHHVDLPDQGIDVLIAQIGVVDRLAVGAEIAQAPAEGDVDIQPQPLAVPIGEDLVKLAGEYKGFYRPGEPHPR